MSNYVILSTEINFSILGPGVAGVGTEKTLLKKLVEIKYWCDIREYFITSDNFAPSLKFEFNHPSLPPYPQFYL